MLAFSSKSAHKIHCVMAASSLQLCAGVPWGLFPPGAQEQDLTCSPAGLEAGIPQLAPLPLSCTSYSSHFSQWIQFSSSKGTKYFSPPDIGWIWLFSKLTHQIHLSLWADSQESPEVEWEEDRTTTFRKPVLTNCKIIHELGKTEIWLHLSFWLHISIHLLLFVCILQHKKCKKIFWCRFPENNGRFWMWTDF